MRNSIYLVGARNTPSRRHLDPLSKFFCATSENRCPLIIASPLGGVKISRLSVVKLPFVCVVAHDRRFRRWATAVNVKLILPPRRSFSYFRCGTALHPWARFKVRWARQPLASQRASRRLVTLQNRIQVETHEVVD